MGASLISNPPYNLRWKPPELAGFLPQYGGYEIPPDSNANMAFILSALSWVDDRAVILLPNNVLASDQKKEKAIRQQLICQNLLLAVISLPANMFESTSIPVHASRSNIFSIRLLRHVIVVTIKIEHQ